MSTVRKRRSARQKEIVETTLLLLRDISADRLSTQTIADHVGITQGGLFRHFPTKNDLWFAVMNEVERRSYNAWDGASQKSDSAIIRLRKILLSQLALIDAYHGILALLFSMGRLAAGDVVHPIHLRIMTGLRLTLVEELTTALRDNELPSNISTLDAKSLLMGAIQDCVLRWSLTARGYDLVAEGDRVIGLQRRLLGAHEQGSRV